MKVTTHKFTRDEILLLHSEYDPVKAREYYLRTRQLKGRKPAAPKPLPTGRLGSTPNTAAPKKSGAQIARQPLLNKKPMNAATAKARVASIQKRLGALENVLKDLIKKRDAIKPTKKAAEKKTAAKGGGGGSAPKRDLTAKQKADNRKRAKEYYDKNKKPAEKKPAQKKETAKELDEKIAKVRGQIKKTKVELAVAKVKAGIK